MGFDTFISGAENTSPKKTGETNEANPSGKMDGLFGPRLESLMIEARKEKKDFAAINKKKQELQAALLGYPELVDVQPAEINSEFDKYFWNYKAADGLEGLFAYVRKITEHATEKETAIRDEKFAKMEKSRKAVRLNQLMIYNPTIDPKAIEIHCLNNRTIPPGRQFVLLRDGLRQLAAVVEKNPKIEIIEGQSWIIREYPTLAKKIGFKIEPQVRVRLREFFNKTPDRFKTDGRGSISRKEFLDKYLQK